jgi:two-component system CheB/CheR fusion protein
MTSHPPFVLAGIGASAGGLQSLEQFFRALPVDTNVAYIVVQHLSAEHKSLMHELLGRFTRIPVVEATDGLEIRPDHIYILTPGHELEVRGTTLAVFPRESDRALAFPIDRLFSSLAENFGARSIAVVLSGSGSDGSRGVVRVEAAGGLVMAEDPELATFDGMPRAAIDSGAVSLVMGAEGLALAVSDHASTGSPTDEDEKQLVDEVIRALHESSSGDFAEYKRGTLHRRIARRARLGGHAALASYAAVVRESEVERNALCHDLLIGVTAFFRDPAAFAALQEEVELLVKSRIEPGRELRVWCAACATGEEAYSMAILFDEASRRENVVRDFKIFATDIHGPALDMAQAGVFPRERLENVSAERLARYFVERSDGRFQVAPTLRQKIVFAKHDLLKDTPFTNLDLVSCRNMLIYLTFPAQRRALASLSYGLRLGSLLFLGSSESPGELAKSYETIHETSKLYRKKQHTKGLIGRELSGANLGRRPHVSQRPESRLLPIYDSLLDVFMPPSFLVSEQRALIDSYGGAEKLLHINKRRPSSDFLDMVPSEVRLVLAGLLVRAQRESAAPPAVDVGWSREDGETTHFRVKAQRLLVRNGEPAVVVSLTCLTSLAIEASPLAPVLGSNEGALELERELAEARTTLQATVEELEASNEELQATNEELVASNEELQSVNEELHSVNEELHTVNAEHQLKIEELSELNRDIGHLLESIDVATVYLDADLRIRKYTPRAGQLFGLVEHDVGRFLASFNHTLYYPTLSDDVAAVRDGEARIEKEVRGHDDKWYFVRLLPYRVGAAIAGVVVTLTDATALASAKSRARQLSAIVESSGDAIIGMTAEGMVTSWNSSAKRLYGYAASDMIGQSIMKLVPDADRPEFGHVLTQIRNGEELINMAGTRKTSSGGLVEIAKTMSPVRDEEGVFIGIATIDRDVRAQRDLERRLRESESRYQDLYDHSPDCLVSVDTRTDRVTDANETHLRVTGRTARELSGAAFYDVFQEEDREAVRNVLDRLRKGEAVRDVSATLVRKDGPGLDVTLSATAVFALDGSVCGARTVLHDVSERRAAELKYAEATRLRERFLAMVSHELRTPLQAINAAFQVVDQDGVPEATLERSQAVVRRQTKQMIRLVDDLLDVSRIVHDKLHFERAPLDLADVVRGSVDACALSFAKKDVRLLTEGLDAPLPAFGDAGRIEQVFGNLLSNALRHTPAGKAVRVVASRVGTECTIRIVDEGRGIDPVDLQSVFDMFSQSNQGLARREGGLGLGLTIAHRIVAAHGGKIAATSDGVGRGATFTVTLTLDESARAREAQVEPKDEKLSIVLVEDQDDAREMMQEMLELDGHRVEAAGDGRAGLDKILALKPQVAVLDIGLPLMTGYEFARAVREKLGRSIRLIAMSGYGQPEDIQMAEQAGFDRHLTKPIDMRRLEHALRESDPNAE